MYKYTHTHICEYNMEAHDVHLLLMLFQAALCLSVISLILLVSSDEYSCRRCDESSLKATTGAWPRPRSWRKACVWGGGGNDKQGLIGTDTGNERDKTQQCVSLGRTRC